MTRLAMTDQISSQHLEYIAHITQVTLHNVTLKIKQMNPILGRDGDEANSPLNFLKLHKCRKIFLLSIIRFLS